MANVNPDVYLAQVDQKARFSDLEVTGTLYAATITQSGNQAVTGTLAVTGLVTPAAGLKLPVVAITGDGAITIAPSNVFLSKGSAAAITLAAPTATTHDGYIITVTAISAQAHVITGSVDGFNAKGSSGTATFGGAKGDSVSFIAYQGHWYTLSKVNVTIA